jgi:hypothetical protein
LLFAVLALLVAGGVAAALWFFVLRDDSGGDAELEAYFAEAAPLINEINDRDFQVTTAGETFLRYATFLGQTGNDLSDVVPPEQAAAAHQELVAGLQDGTSALADLYDQYSEVTSLDEVQRILQEDPAFAEAYGRAVAACTDLKGLADKSDIEVTLDLCASAQPTASSGS